MSLVVKPDWRHFAVILLFASVVRGGVLWLTLDSLSADTDAYRRISQCLTIHGTFGLESIDAESGRSVAIPTAYRPPLYPWLLSWLSGPVVFEPSGPAAQLSSLRVAILHWLMGTVTAVATYAVAKTMLRRRCVESFAPNAAEPNNLKEGQLSVAAMVAGGLVAIDPLLLQSASLVMTETLAALLAVAILWGWCGLVDSLERRDDVRRTLGMAVLTGTLCGFAYLCRPTFVLWPALLGTYLLGRGVLARDQRTRWAGGLMLAVLMVFVGAWSTRNYLHFDKPIWATTHGGYTLLLGNNPSFYDYVRTVDSLGKAWDATFFIDRWERRSDADPRAREFWDKSSAIERTRPYMPPTGEVADDRLAYETAVATIKREPMSFVRASLWRLWRLHSPHPLQTQKHSMAMILIVTTFYLVAWAMVIGGIFVLGRKILQPRWAASITLWGALAAVHTIYWTDMRMRAPLVPVLAILAGACVLAWLQRTRNFRLSNRQS